MLGIYSEWNKFRNWHSGGTKIVIKNRRHVT